jgi:transcriptional regulator with XRE-family HTH domain
MTTEDNSFGQGIHPGLAQAARRVTARTRQTDQHLRAIIGRYERSEITPSINVAKKLADGFRVTLDYLFDGRELANILQNQTTLACWREIDALVSKEREGILLVVDSLLRVPMPAKSTA